MRAWPDNGEVLSPATSGGATFEQFGSSELLCPQQKSPQYRLKIERFRNAVFKLATVSKFQRPDGQFQQCANHWSTVMHTQGQD